MTKINPIEIVDTVSNVVECLNREFAAQANKVRCVLEVLSRRC